MRKKLPYRALNLVMFCLKVRRLEVESAVRVAVNKAVSSHRPVVPQLKLPVVVPPSVYSHVIVSVPCAPSHVTSLLDESMSKSIKLDWHCRRLKPEWK